MKTKNKARHAARYAFSPTDKILVDTNVWLYLQPPAAQPTPTWAAAYSAVFAQIFTAKAKVVTDSLILSEYINRYIRIEYEAIWKSTYPKFKRFRSSNDGITLAKAAVAEVRAILKNSVPQDTQLSNMPIYSVLTATETGTMDFNDALLIESCRQNRWKLLTHDGDMEFGGIEVLTTNENLLSKCP